MVAINSNIPNKIEVGPSGGSAGGINVPNQSTANTSASITALKDKAAQEKQKIKGLAEDFEAIFLNIVLKSMRDSVQKSGLIDGGNAEEVYRSMLDSEYAKTIAAQRSTGLADNIEKYLLDAAQLGDKSDKLISSAKQGLDHYRQQINSGTLPLMQKSATIE